jgi:hypothetical protein
MSHSEQIRRDSDLTKVARTGAERDHSLQLVALLFRYLPNYRAALVLRGKLENLFPP